MELINAYKTKLSVNNKQKGLFRQHAGASRYVYNVVLASWQEQYKLHSECPAMYVKPSEYTMRTKFNAIKGDICPWVRGYPYCIVEWTTGNLGEAYQHFYRKLKQGLSVGEAGLPKFKGRGFPGSFGVRGYKTKGNQIYLGKVIGWVNFAQKDYVPTPIKYKVNGGTVYSVVSEDAVGDWYVSVTVYEDFEPLETNPLAL